MPVALRFGRGLDAFDVNEVPCPRPGLLVLDPVLRRPVGPNHLRPEVEEHPLGRGLLLPKLNLHRNMAARGDDLSDSEK